VFDLERRIYRVDRMRLNPGGIPVRGVVYTLAAVAASYALRPVPLAGGAMASAPWYARDIALPLLAGTLLSLLTIEGRPFHTAAPALARPRRRSARRQGLVSSPASRRWSPGQVLVLPDGGDGRLRRLRYDGPGAVLVGVPHRRSEVMRARLSGGFTVLEITPAGSPGRHRREVVQLGRGGRLVVVPRCRGGSSA
jgi:hypothetical protein